MGNKTPVQKTERIVAIDVLRGFALLGILGANILFFDVEESYLEDWSKVVDDMAVGAGNDEMDENDDIAGGTDRGAVHILFMTAIAEEVELSLIHI